VRGKILNALLARMKTDERLFFLTGDMGINLVEPIEEAFPKRFLNVGIAEQNLIGVAGGLCNLGFLPVVYTISNFLIHRCLEQIRDDIVHQVLDYLTRSPVKVRQGRASTVVMQPVAFSDLSSEYIGILYEGLLDYELKPVQASDGCMVCRHRA